MSLSENSNDYLTDDVVNQHKSKSTYVDYTNTPKKTQIQHSLVFIPRVQSMNIDHMQIAPFSVSQAGNNSKNYVSSWTQHYP
jgi:hypothetical protein